MPKISVIMPVYNVEKYLRQAMESILSQTYRNFELVIVNDASPDNSEGIVKSFDDPRIVYIKNEKNLGLSGAFNTGIRAARGEFIARMDPDDKSLRERFQKQITYLEGHPEIGVLGSAVITMDEEGNPGKKLSKPLSNTALKWQSLFSTPLFHPTVMGRANIFKENPYREDLPNSEDYELWSRLMFEKGVKLANLAEPLLLYRVFPKSFTQSLPKERRRNSLANSLRNIGRYLPLTPAEEELFAKIMTGEPSLKESFKVLNLYIRLRKKFIEKESFKPSLKPFAANLLKRFLRSITPNPNRYS